jgi:epoxyqueuosine reductase
MALEMTEALSQWASARGYRAAWGSLAALEEARSGIERRLQAGEIDPEFHQEQLRVPEVCATPGSSDLKTVVVVAVPRPAHTVRFTLESGPFEAILPPTYVRYRGLPQEVLEDLRASVFLPPARLDILSAPLKALAGSLGLVSYGRNNITYVPGMGSYFQLAGFLTDADPDLAPGWRPQPPERLAACENCESCFSLCPSGAIDAERFLLRAERCLTLFSETPGDWPAWFSPSMHRCLIGCLDCQQSCPENAGLLGTEPSGIWFTREETQAILADDGRRSGPVWADTARKFDAARMTHFEPVLCRNLRALLSTRV